MGRIGKATSCFEARLDVSSRSCRVRGHSREAPHHCQHQHKPINHDSHNSSMPRAAADNLSSVQFTWPAPKKQKVCACMGRTPGTAAAPSKAASDTAAVHWMSSLKAGDPRPSVRCTAQHSVQPWVSTGPDHDGTPVAPQPPPNPQGI